MELQAIPSSREASCYVCGIREVLAICHHCRRGMCSQHVSEITYPFLDKYFRQVSNPEFTGLGLEEWNQPVVGVHCQFCEHVIRSNELLYAGMLCLSVGLLTFTLIASISVGFSAEVFLSFLIFAGLSGIGAMGFLHARHRRLTAVRNQRPPVPVFGRTLNIRATEGLRGTVRLNAQGHYEVLSDPPAGRLDCFLQLSLSDKLTVQRYCTKYGFSISDGLSFNAGILLALSKEMIRFDEELQQENVRALTGTLKDIPFLHGLELVHSEPWHLRQNYVFALNEAETTGLPVQIVPTLISEDREWALELTVQVNPKIDTSSLVGPNVEQLWLDVPSDLGPLQSKNPAADVEVDEKSVAEDVYRVVWRGVELEQMPNGIHSRSFYVRFENSSVQRPNMIISGQLHLRFVGTLTKLERVVWFSPLGHSTQVDLDEVDASTDVRIHFNFDLSGLKLREPVIDRISVGPAPIIPEGRLITILVNRLSVNDIYVQRVIENPPRTNRVNANIMNRLWVIAGRRYVKAYPIDFRIVALGQEYYDASDHPCEGTTRFEITTQAVVTDGSTARREIRLLQNDIRAVIDQIIADGRAGILVDDT